MLSKLDYLYSFYNAKSQERTNQILQILTIVSVIFLPLNLAVGYFGMNTTNLPFSNMQNGTFYATLLIVMLAIFATIILIKWRKNDNCWQFKQNINKN